MSTFLIERKFLKYEKMKIYARALTGVAQLVGRRPARRRVASLMTSGRGTCLGCRFGPDWGCARGNGCKFLSHIDVSLPFFLPPFPSLEK